MVSQSISKISSHSCFCNISQIQKAVTLWQNNDWIIIAFGFFTLVKLANFFPWETYLKIDDVENNCRNVRRLPFAKLNLVHSNSFNLLATKRSKNQFASVNPAFIHDSGGFYWIIINQRALVTEKDGHSMQISPLDILMHNGSTWKLNHPLNGWYTWCKWQKVKHAWISST